MALRGPDRVQRDLIASEPDEMWFADFTAAQRDVGARACRRVDDARMSLMPLRLSRCSVTDVQRSTAMADRVDLAAARLIVQAAAGRADAQPAGS